MTFRLRIAAALVTLALPASLDAQRPERTVPIRKDVVGPPPIAREFRGAWVAAVSYIDWPSRPGLTVGEQKRELLAILDRLVELRLNAVVLHVRPAADALYASQLEPWSSYVTGRQGRPPEPAWDPLAFAVDEAHARGLELHAWFNPYRAFHESGRAGDTARTHIARTNPELVRRYGSDLWMDPGDPAVRRRTLEVIADVVRRYDIDAVHLDDYFYPYRVNDRRGRTIPFPDAATYEAYRARGGRLPLSDWRRDNVNTFVRELYEQTRRQKPHVRVGISPFGIWRPGHPSGISGLDAFEEIYADSRLWLQRGWVDYFAPQLYWHPDAERQSFSRLLAWWANRQQNPHERHIWPGLFTNRVIMGQSRPQWTADAITRQIAMARAEPAASGHVHFSMRGLLRNPDNLSSRLATTVYREPALVPASPWLDAAVPAAPAARIVRDTRTGGDRLELRSPATVEAPWLWTVQFRDAGAWRTEVVPGRMRSMAIPRGTSDYWVSAVNRVGNQSDIVPASTPSEQP